MGHVIAVAGKGGVGKTTLTGLLIQYLCQSGKKPVLAVDADANSKDVYKRQGRRSRLRRTGSGRGSERRL